MTESSEESAYHEAGHAYMAIHVGVRVRSITIDPDRDVGPLRHADITVEWPRGRFTRRSMHERAVLVALAGPVAEMLYRSEPYHPGFVAEWSADWQMAWDAATPLVASERERLRYLEQTTVELYRMLDHSAHWAAVAAIVDHLLAHETLEGVDVEEIVAQWRP